MDARAKGADMMRTAMIRRRTRPRVVVFRMPCRAKRHRWRDKSTSSPAQRTHRTTKTPRRSTGHGPSERNPKGRVQQGESPQAVVGEQEQGNPPVVRTGRTSQARAGCWHVYQCRRSHSPPAGLSRLELRAVRGPCRAGTRWVPGIKPLDAGAAGCRIAAGENSELSISRLAPDQRLR